MVIYYFDLMSIPFVPDKANSPLMVDSNAVLAIPISRKGLQPVPGRHSQVIDASGVVQKNQPHLRTPLKFGMELADTPTLGDGLGVPVPVAADHTFIIAFNTISVNH